MVYVKRKKKVNPYLQKGMVTQTKPMRDPHNNYGSLLKLH